MGEAMSWERVLMIDKRDGTVLRSFRSPEDAGRATKVSASTIRSSADNKTLIKKRFFFRYASDWQGHETFETATHRPVIATRDMGEGRHMVRWYSTIQDMGRDIGANPNLIGNCIRKGHRVSGWRVRYALGTAEWPQIADQIPKSMED